VGDAGGPTRLPEAHAARWRPCQRKCRRGQRLDERWRCNAVQAGWEDLLAPCLCYECNPLLQWRAISPEAILRLGGVLVAQRHAAHDDLLVLDAEQRPDLAVVGGERGLRAGVEA